MTEQQNPNEEPEFVDKRRIDPETGKLREPAAGADPSEPATGDDLPTISDEALHDLLDEAMSASTPADSPQPPAAAGPGAPEGDLAAERLEDLRRVQAEYANYRRRAERELGEAAEVASADIGRRLLPVLDDLGRAEAAGDLPAESAMGVIAAKLRGVIERLGIESYGAKGDVFDPQAYEAIAQLPNPEVTETVVADVIEPGYRLGERELRPAKVAVFVPAS